jgi:hypothetical protein
MFAKLITLEDIDGIECSTRWAQTASNCSEISILNVNELKNEKERGTTPNFGLPEPLNPCILLFQELI